MLENDEDQVIEYFFLLQVNDPDRDIDVLTEQLTYSAKKSVRFKSFKQKKKKKNKKHDWFDGNCFLYEKRS